MAQPTVKYPLSTSLALTATLCAPEALAAGSFAARLPYLTIGALMVALLTLGGVLISGRRMQRELQRRARDRDHELAERRHMEARLRVIQQELEARLVDKEDELVLTQEQLGLARRRLEAISARLEKVARIDAETGVANRRRFDEALEEEIKRMVRDQNPLSLMLVEPDFHEAFEHSYGAERAGEALTRIAETMSGTFRRAGDLVARVSENKFAVIMPASDAKIAARFSERLIRSVHDLCIPHDRNEAGDRVTVSIGIATMMPNKLHAAKELIESAQIALGRSWEGGHNRAESTFVS